MTLKNTTFFLSASSGASAVTGSNNDRVFTLLGRFQSQIWCLCPNRSWKIVHATPFSFCSNQPVHRNCSLTNCSLTNLWAFASLHYFLQKHLGTGGVGKSTIMKQMIRTLVSSHLCISPNDSFASVFTRYKRGFFHRREKLLSSCSRFGLEFYLHCSSPSRSDFLSTNRQKCSNISWRMDQVLYIDAHGPWPSSLPPDRNISTGIPSILPLSTCVCCLAHFLPSLTSCFVPGLLHL